MDRKINSITIGNESRYEWEISKLMNNPRCVFIVFKDTTNVDSLLHNNSKFISFGGGNDQFIKSLQLHVDNVRLNLLELIKVHMTQRETFIVLLIYMKE